MSKFLTSFPVICLYPYQLAGQFHAPEDVEWALDDSLRKLGVDYLDLYLIHL